MKRKVNKTMVSRIKDRVSRSTQGMGKFFRVPTGSKAKVRFITDLDEAVPIVEHDKYGEVFPTICVDHHFGMECRFCGDDSVRKREVYCWTIYDYAAKEKKIVKFAANNFTPTPQLISFFETYGTLLDRDYVISKSGQGKDISYGVVPLDKAEFPKKMRSFTEQEVLEQLVESSDEIDIDEIEELKAKTKVEKEDDTEDEEFEFDDEVTEEDEEDAEDEEPFDDEDE